MQHIPTVLDHGFEYIGGDLSTDFINTTSNRYDRTQHHEHIQTYADLVEFARLAGAIKPSLARELIAEAGRRAEKATQVHRRTVALREALWRAYSRLAQGREPAQDDLDVISREAGDALAHGRFVKTADGLAWDWPETSDLARPLWSVARAASDLLSSSHDRELIRECADDVCAWMFVDRTKNHSRRWCDMGNCGTKNKVRAFRQRQRQRTRAGVARQR
jgi:predicted RNA-binding Zn ribbon-like protein